MSIYPTITALIEAGKRKPRGVESIARPDLMTYVTTHCQQWVRESKGLIAYRGYRDVGHVAVVPIRQDRQPRDLDDEDHQMLTRMIARQGLVANRSNSTFITSNSELAAEYNARLYVAIPVGAFHYTWSPAIEDPVTAPKVLSVLALADKDPTKQLDASLKFRGDDGSLPAALMSGNEIMVSAQSILLVDPDVWEALTA